MRFNKLIITTTLLLVLAVQGSKPFLKAELVEMDTVVIEKKRAKEILVKDPKADIEA